MAITISNAFIEEYEDRVRQLAQQNRSKLRPHVMEVSSGGKAYHFERLGSTAMVEKTTRRVDTVYVDDTWSSRTASPRTFTHTMTIEHEDKVQMLVQPENAYAESQAMAQERQIDDLIIEAATGAAADKQGASHTFPTAQRIGDGTGDFTFDNVTQVQQVFMTNEIETDIPKCFVVGPLQVRRLMQLTEQTSMDYVKRSLQDLTANGIVPEWMGFTWIMSNRLLNPAAGQLDTLAFTKRALGLAVNQDYFTRIGEDPGKSYMLQVFGQLTMGAVRVEDEHIVNVRAKNT